MPGRVFRSVPAPFAPEYQSAVLGPFIVVEDHARRTAIGMRVLLALDDKTRRLGFVRDGQAQCAIGFSEVDPLYIEFLKRHFLRGSGESVERRKSEYRR